MPSSPQTPDSRHGQRNMRRRRKFRPRLWSCVVTILVCALFVGLGIWQIRRGQEKAIYLAQRAHAMAAHPDSLVDLPDSRLPPDPDTLRVVARGHYLTDKQLLLEGQSHGGSAGYDVLTPFVLADGNIVIVNRGWIPRRNQFGGGYNANLDVPARKLKITGLWRTLPAPGLRLDAHNCRAQPWPRHVSYPTHADLRCLYGPRVRQGEIELARDQPHGFVRDWRSGVGFPPMRHYGYAAQWFLFALVALYLFYRLNLRRQPPDGESAV